MDSSNQQSMHETQELTSREASDAILTIPNIISFVRLIAIPVFFVLILHEHNVLSTIIFALAAATDFVDGYIARKTKSVSKLGKILDPAVDRLLMIFAVIGLMLIGRLPAWIMILILLRDVIMLFGYYIMLKLYDVRVSVILAGKIATTLLYIGLTALCMNWPLLNGLGITHFLWLPGFSDQLYCWGIWFLYAGVLLGVFTTSYYAIIGLLACHEVIVKTGL